MGKKRGMELGKGMGIQARQVEGDGREGKITHPQ